MRAIFWSGLAVALLASTAIRAADPAPVYTDQGTNWTPATRADFYSRDQGSRMIPLTWLQILNRPAACRSCPTISPATAICRIPPTATGFRSALRPRAPAALRSRA